MNDEKEKYSLIDWIGSVIGFVVIGFIVFILIWPLIDPTPNKSSSIKENLHQALGKGD
jgi:large-conductance mechanosensitive channel